MRLTLGRSACVVLAGAMAACGARKEDSTAATGATTQNDASDEPTGEGGETPASLATEPAGSVANPSGGAGPTGATGDYTSGASVSESGAPPIIFVPPGPSGGDLCRPVCGNGEIETCSCGGGTGATGPFLQLVLPPPPDEEPCVIREACDGEAEHGKTCEGLGFNGGTLACDARCDLDESECRSCGSDPALGACREDIALGKNAQFVTLASNGVELALGWTRVCGAKVTWLDESLTTSRSFEFDVEPCEPTWLPMTVAPLGDNWVIEVASTQFVVDGAATVMASRSIVGSALFGAARIGSTPLVVREAAYGVVHASLLDETGAEVWSTPIDDEVVEAPYASATAVADGFLVALRNRDAGVEVVHLDAAGAITARTNPGSAQTEYPQLAASDGEVRLVWTDFNDGDVLWSKLDAAGRRLGEVAVLGGTPSQFNRSPLAVAGANSVVVLGGYTGGTGIGQASTLRVVDAAGASVGADIVVQSDPHFVRWPQVLMFKGSAITAWVGGGRVGVARITL